MKEEDRKITEAIKARARKVQEEMAKDNELAARHSQSPAEVVAEKMLNPVVLNKPDDAVAMGGCNCNQGNCGVGCQGVVGLLHGSYGCDKATPL